MYGIPDSGASEYSTTDTSNSGIGKYYMVKKYIVFLTLAAVNKPVK
jgi:hypothetical protein